MVPAPCSAGGGSRGHEFGNSVETASPLQTTRLRSWCIACSFFRAQQSAHAWSHFVAWTAAQVAAGSVRGPARYWQRRPPALCALVDANLRLPSLAAQFQIESDTGFANAMKSSQPMSDFARNVRPNKLWVLTSGATGNEPDGSLNPARLREKFSELRSQFDYVLVDTPPTDSYADALLLGQMTDGIILVVGSNLTRRESARIAKESFDGAGIPIIGAVLNKRTFPIPEALYRIL